MEYVKNTESSYEHEFLQTWSDIVATNIRNDKVKVNHDSQKLNGCQFSLFVDSTGFIEKVAGVNNRARENVETARSFRMFLGNNMLCAQTEIIISMLKFFIRPFRDTK